MNSPEQTLKRQQKAAAFWEPRIADVVACPDNLHLPRVPEAGRLEEDIITMHNGIRLHGLSYYGEGNRAMLVENKGVHEPQEERAFMEVLKHLPPKSTMLELGSYWAFYSLWFATVVESATSYMIEPESRRMESGKKNFALNGKTGHFRRAWIDHTDLKPPSGTPTVSVDGFCTRYKIEHLAILHADIQGKEVAMLQGARRMLSGGKIDYVFVSTHSDRHHYNCLEILQAHGYNILASADKRNTYSFDGLIVAKRGTLTNGPTQLEIAHKSGKPDRERVLGKWIRKLRGLPVKAK